MSSYDKLSLQNNLLSNTLRGDDKGLDWRWGSTLGVLNPAALAADAYVSYGLLPRVKQYPGASPNDVGYKLTQKLDRFAQHKGIDVKPSLSPHGYFYAPKGQIGNARPMVIAGSGHNASLLAHELGHATQYQPMLRGGASHIVGQLGSALGALGAGFSRDETNSRRSAIAGSLSAVPMLGVELDASIRGANIMRRLGAKNIFGPLSGLPTYAAVAAAPLAAHYTKKLLGGFEHKKTAADHVALPRLLEAKQHSDQSRYALKNQILKELMDQSPEDWVIDDSKPKYKGVTHTPTRFRLHADPRIINSKVKAANSIELLAKLAFVLHSQR